MSLLTAGLVALVGLWVAWKVVKIAVKLAVLAGVGAVVYLVLLPRLQGLL